MRICFVGDSFVNGTGDPQCLGWVGRACAARLQPGEDVTVYNLGVRGATTADILARWWPEITHRLPDGMDGRVVFSFGTNDTTLEAAEDTPWQTRVALADSLSHTRQILQTTVAIFPVLMVSPPPIGDRPQNQRTQRLILSMMEICQELHIPWLDVFTPLQQSNVWMREVAANDGAHPFAGGYTAFSELVLAWEAWQQWFS
jgi:lysophospholipase L1-like esterase